MPAPTPTPGESLFLSFTELHLLSPNNVLGGRHEVSPTKGLASQPDGGRNAIKWVSHQGAAAAGGEARLGGALPPVVGAECQEGQGSSPRSGVPVEMLKCEWARLSENEYPTNMQGLCSDLGWFNLHKIWLLSVLQIPQALFLWQPRVEERCCRCALFPSAPASGLPWLQEELLTFQLDCFLQQLEITSPAC